MVAGAVARPGARPGTEPEREVRVSNRAIEYVMGLKIPDLDTKRVFMVLAGLTPASSPGQEPPQTMGLKLMDSDIPTLAERARLDPQEFRQLLRTLTRAVAMDVVEHGESWEFTYGPAYTSPAPPSAPAPPAPLSPPATGTARSGKADRQVNKVAVAYVQGLGIGDALARRVFLLLAARTEASRYYDTPEDTSTPEIMGLELRDADIPALATEAGISADSFREQLRVLKRTVKMDVLEHKQEGVWEIVYGPSYTDPPPPPRPKSVDPARVGPIHPFWMPGWDHYSTWGWEEGLGHFYAQIIHNSDDRDTRPRIWITPPTYVMRTVDQLAEAIATAIAPYEAVAPPTEMIKRWLLQPPLHRR